MRRCGNWIHGEEQPVSDQAALPMINPSTGETYGLMSDSDEADVKEAVESASDAFPRWKAMAARDRAAIMNRIADLVARRADELAEAESLDQGKPVKLARQMDIPRVEANFRFFAGAIVHAEDRAFDLGSRGFMMTQRMPVGVAGLISPWNLPLYLLTWKIAPAIAAGNTAVAKPSELTSLTAWMLGGIMKDAGLPPGVVNLVFGTGPKAGDALVAHPSVPIISFTGGTQTGVTISQRAAPMVKKLSLELGGKNANIVFADADLDRAVETSLWAGFQNQGEICLCGSRILVERSVYDHFVTKLVDRVSALKVGDPRDPSTDVGALVSSAHRDKVEGYIQSIRDDGGRIWCGGDRPNLAGPFQNGFFLNPVVATDVAPHCRAVQDEIFGPVVTVWPFDEEEEAISLANDSRYGLAAVIQTSNLERAHRVAAEIQAGTVWVNTWMFRDLRVPFGGMKESGIGREGGQDSLDFYSEVKTIALGYSM